MEQGITRYYSVILISTHTIPDGNIDHLEFYSHSLQKKKRTMAAKIDTFFTGHYTFHKVKVLKWN